jgi:hypothetical protein
MMPEVSGGGYSRQPKTAAPSVVAPKTSSRVGSDLVKAASSRIQPMKTEDYVALVAALVAEISAIAVDGTLSVCISQENISRWQEMLVSGKVKVMLHEDRATRTMMVEIVQSHNRKGQEASCSGPHVTCPYADPCRHGCRDNANNPPPPSLLNKAGVRRRGKSDAAKEVFGG